jgi:hypothetical protein
MTSPPSKPLTSDERIFLAMAVDDALIGHIGDSLPHHHACKPITSIDELERRFRVLDWASSLISAAARAGVHSTHYDVPYAQLLADATNFVRAAEGMAFWLRPKGVDDVKPQVEPLRHCAICEAPITAANPEPWGAGAGCENCQGGAKHCR